MRTDGSYDRAGDGGSDNAGSSCCSVGCAPSRGCYYYTWRRERVDCVISLGSLVGIRYHVRLSLKTYSGHSFEVKKFYGSLNLRVKVIINV